MVAIIISKCKGLINLKSSLVAACLHLSLVAPSGLLKQTLRLQREIADDAMQQGVPGLGLPITGERLR